MRSLLFSVMLIATPVVAGKPVAPPSAVPAAAPAAGDRIALARQFMAMTEQKQEMMTMFREAAISSATMEMPDLEEADMDRVLGHLDRLLIKAGPMLERRFPDIIEAYAQAYAREFSGEELRGLIAFAGTPVGKRYFSRSGHLETDEGVARVTGEIMTELGEIMAANAREICARNAADKIAAGDTKARCPLAASDFRGS